MGVGVARTLFSNCSSMLSVFGGMLTKKKKKTTDQGAKALRAIPRFPGPGDGCLTPIGPIIYIGEHMVFFAIVLSKLTIKSCKLAHLTFD